MAPPAVPGGFPPWAGAWTGCPGTAFAGGVPRKKTAAPPPSKIPTRSMTTYLIFYLHCVGLGLVAGDAVGDAGGGGGAVFMFISRALSTAATVFVTAFT